MLMPATCYPLGDPQGPLQRTQKLTPVEVEISNPYLCSTDGKMTDDEARGYTDEYG
jgi:hypothetical protein